MEQPVQTPRNAMVQAGRQIEVETRPSRGTDTKEQAPGVHPERRRRDGGGGGGGGEINKRRLLFGGEERYSISRSRSGYNLVRGTLAWNGRRRRKGNRKHLPVCPGAEYEWPLELPDLRAPTAAEQFHGICRAKSKMFAQPLHGVLSPLA